MSRSKDCFLCLCNGNSQRHGSIVAWRTAHDQHIYAAVMFCHKCPHCQRAHTVPHQDQRKFRIVCMDFPVHCSDILKHRLCSPTVCKAEIILMFYTFSMSSVIMNHHHISKFCQILHKRNISLFMLTHSMNQLYNCTIRFLIRYQCHDRNLKPVCF